MNGNPDATVKIDGRFYEVPPEYVGARVELRFPIARPDEIVRYYGAYSVRRRAAWRRAGILRRNAREKGWRARQRPQDDARDVTHLAAAPRSPQGWAELLRGILEVDPLACPRCGSSMLILAFILDHHAILDHLQQHGRDPRTVSAEDFHAPSRAPRL